MHEQSNEHEEREPLSIDATGGDWLKPRVRLGDDFSLYVRDPDAVSGTRRVEALTDEWLDRIGELRGGDLRRLLVARELAKFPLLDDPARLRLLDGILENLRSDEGAS